MTLILNGDASPVEQHQPRTAAGDADIDITAADYSAYTTLLTITPGTNAPIMDLVLDLDWNKATTGFDNIATAADTLDVVLVSKIDGTNLRHLMSGTQVVANGDGSLDDTESGERFNIGAVAVAATIVVKILLSAERADAEIPYRVTYRAAATATITPVVAG